MPHAARIAPGRTGSQHGLAFEKQDIVDAVAREMVSGARAHAPAADYDHVRCSLHDLKSEIHVPSSKTRWVCMKSNAHLAQNLDTHLRTMIVPAISLPP